MEVSNNYAMCWQTICCIWCKAVVVLHFCLYWFMSSVDSRISFQVIPLFSASFLLLKIHLILGFYFLFLPDTRVPNILLVKSVARHTTHTTEPVRGYICKFCLYVSFFILSLLFVIFSHFHCVDS